MIGVEKGTLILYDKQTGSWWSQLFGEASKGPMKGRKLVKLPSTMTTWGKWKALHPGTTVYVKRSIPYGYCVLFNINICRNNLEDVKQLTEIVYQNGIATDYHINESPMLEQSHFQHLHDNDTFIRPEDRPQVDELLDWLIEKNCSGYKMVNSVQRLNDMKEFMRGKVEP